MSADLIRRIDAALATLAIAIRAHGDHGLAYLPVFERLEREREALASIDDRLERALARVREQPSRSPKRPSADLRSSRISAA